MTEEINAVKTRLVTENFTCVLQKGSLIYTSTARGVSPLLNWLDEGVNFSGFCAADKVVGKGAAFLYALFGIKALYAVVISDSAKSVFDRCDIPVFYGQRVPRILNRDKTGFCPIESAVLDIEEPEQALIAIREKLNALEGERK